MDSWTGICISKLRIHSPIEKFPSSPNSIRLEKSTVASSLSTKKPILHISINPHPEDVLTDQQLSDIAKEYMRKLGYGDQPYLVYKHTDINRHHIHIVGLRVDENGRPLNDKFEHRRSKQKPVNWRKNTGFTRQSERNVPNARNLKRWTTPPGT